MVSRPELKEDTNYVNGLAASILFVVLAAVFLTASFGESAGFPRTRRSSRGSATR
ncbi:hypothetical protein SY89_01722 [Halolamina pelagica]|uniref:Uncharacterized protein n=1 Tax=Halolamina pelagica TaxID=699431 RepID=A0A0P7HVP1_9EURY|nr:hypothetical protein [Halolamina pelagica]KPN30980.1 hypothetical protein SY89_01722 [Halolamina pelagica]